MSEHPISPIGIKELQDLREKRLEERIFDLEREIIDVWMTQNDSPLRTMYVEACIENQRRHG